MPKTPALLAICVASLWSTLSHAQDYRRPGLTPRYQAATVDDVRRPGFNGSLYVRRPVIGGVEAWAWDTGSPGADYYGAHGADRYTALLTIDAINAYDRTDYGIVNPWQAANDRTNRRNPYSNAFTRAQDRASDRLEVARQEWLREQGLTGGVRTHVNDAALLGLMSDEQSSAMPQPRATIILPEGAPVLKRNIRVEGPARISLPMGAPAELAARSASRGGWINASPEQGDAVAIRH
jgi:hypothetical protein